MKPNAEQPARNRAQEGYVESFANDFTNWAGRAIREYNERNASEVNKYALGSAIMSELHGSIEGFTSNLKILALHSQPVVALLKGIEARGATLSTEAVRKLPSTLLVIEALPATVRTFGEKAAAAVKERSTFVSDYLDDFADTTKTGFANQRAIDEAVDKFYVPVRAHFKEIARTLEDLEEEILAFTSEVTADQQNKTFSSEDRELATALGAFATQIDEFLSQNDY